MSNLPVSLLRSPNWSHRVPIGGVARSKWASRRTNWRKAAPARPVKPTRAASAKCFQRAIRVEYFDAGARPRMDVEERLMACAVPGVRWRPRCHHAALSKGSARANPRRDPAAFDARLQAVKTALLQAFIS